MPKKNLKKNNIGIFILSYRRLKNLKKVLKKVKQNISKEDILYIFADGINYKKSYIEQQETLEVINYLQKIKNNKIKVLFQKKNIGLKKNWERAYDFMFKKFDKVICLQDDDVIKKNFIKYMAYYLNKFEHNKKVMNITGFATKVDVKKNYPFDSYFTKRSISYSQASWKRVWKLYNKTNKNSSKIIKNKYSRNLLNAAGTDLLPLMILEHFKFIDSIQVWWSWNIIKNKGFCLNPLMSQIENTGFTDNKATHFYKKKFNQNNKIFNKKIKMNKILYDEYLNNEFKSNYDTSKISFYIFNYAPLFIIKILYQFKKMLLN